MLRMKFCGENRHLRQARNRYGQLKEKLETIIIIKVSEICRNISVVYIYLFMVILPAKIFKVILTLLATEFETGNDNYN